MEWNWNTFDNPFNSAYDLKKILNYSFAEMILELSKENSISTKCAITRSNQSTLLDSKRNILFEIELCDLFSGKII